VPISQVRVTAVGLLLGAAALAATVASPQGVGAAADDQRSSGSVNVTGSTLACSTGVAVSPDLPGVHTAFADGLLEPFGVAFAPDSRHLLVDSLFTPSAQPGSTPPMSSPSGITEYSVTGSALVKDRSTSSSASALVGMAVSPNGHVLAAANNNGASIFSLPRIDQTPSAPGAWLLGTFVSGGQGGIETAFSADSAYLFVSLENSSELAVFNLKRALKDGFKASDLVGYVPLGLAPVGLAVSPNGRYLYATSEAANMQEPGNSGPSGREGTLSTIDMDRAEQDPAHSVISTVWAGCSPVRVVASKSDVFVTARGSNELIEFSSAGLVSQPEKALVGRVEVGEFPVGLALVDGGKDVVVADSNRFNLPNARSDLAVVSNNGSEPLRLVGYVKAGAFPRDVSVSPNGRTLAVSNFGSGEIETVQLSTLP
jgi:DNA-binding beta-propeller fold protein YncE